MKQENVIVIKETLKNFITKIRLSELFRQIYTYYVQEASDLNADKLVHIKMDYPSLKLQLKRKILSQRNNYWDLKDENVSIVENAVSTKDFDKEFKTYCENLFKKSLKDLSEEIEQQEQNEKNQFEESIRKFIHPQEDLLFEPVKLVLTRKLEFPFKSDVIKALLMLKLNDEQIFNLCNLLDRSRSPRGYITKYRQEREDLIKQGKLREYPLEEEIKEIMTHK